MTEQPKQKQSADFTATHYILQTVKLLLTVSRFLKKCRQFYNLNCEHHFTFNCYSCFNNF